MKHLSVLVVAMAVGAVSACSDDDGGGRAPGAAGSAGTAGLGGVGGTGGVAGAAGVAGASGTGGGNPGPPPVPALPATAATLACPTVITGALAASDGTQTGRHSRVAPVSACGTDKAYPGNDADPSNPHLFDVYRFENPTAAAVCFTFTLNNGEGAVVDPGTDAGALDAGPDAAGIDPVVDGGVGDGGADASVVPPVGGVGPVKYLTAYGTFYPTDLSLEFLGDVGATLTSPWTMGVTVPAGETVDVVVYAIDNAPLGVGSYTLSCSSQ
jgi:hypothetical protein